MQNHPISRKTFTKMRRQLTKQQREYTAFCASLQLVKLHGLLPKHAKIGLYLDDFGELPTAPLIWFCRRFGYTPFLPITKTGKPLTFAPMHDLTHTPLKRHQLGMLEPVSRHIIPAHQLDAIFCPLVAVDRQGVRLGMGGGFYDRTLAMAPNTLAIGWCYDFQFVDTLPKADWDQAVDLIITDKRLLRF